MDEERWNRLSARSVWPFYAYGVIVLLIVSVARMPCAALKPSVELLTLVLGSAANYFRRGRMLFSEHPRLRSHSRWIRPETFLKTHRSGLMCAIHNERCWKLFLLLHLKCAFPASCLFAVMVVLTQNDLLFGALFQNKHLTLIAMLSRQPAHAIRLLWWKELENERKKERKT